MTDMFVDLANTLVDTLGETAYVLPEIIVIIAAMLSPLLYYMKKGGKLSATVSLILVMLSAVIAILMMHAGAYGGAYGIFHFDAFSGLMMLLFLAVAALTILISQGHVETTKHKGEYYMLICGATAGMMFVASATNLVAIFVGVELVSIFSYAMVSLKKNDSRSAEAAVKYLIIGALSSALSLYGMSMIFGVTGSLDIYGPNGIIAAVSRMATGNWAFVIGCVGMIAGYGFKIAAVPFHAWAPDVYEGASTPVSGFLAVASKKMGFVVLLKIFIGLFVVSMTGVLTTEIQYIFAIIAAITMTVGNLVAISQDNIKRMLAYSSIAQAGYILIALAVMSQYAVTGGLFHMFTHVVMKGGAFVIVAALITAGLGEKIYDYRGLAKRAPFVAAAMMIFLFSLAGIPPLAGFTSKFILFSGAIVDVTGAVSMQWIWLAFIAVLNSAISLYYYARVVKTMYIEKADDESPVKIGKAFTVAIVLCLIGVIVMGVYPTIILDLCAEAAATLFSFV